MKKIFILLALLPFSLFGEINPSDLSGIETDLGKIQDDVSTIEMIGNQSVTHLQYIRTISAEILYLLQDANIGSQLGDVNTKLNGISNRSQTIIDQLNEFLPQIKSNLESANTTLSIIQTEISYLDDRLETFQSEVNQWLQSIDYKLTDIKTAITDGFENLNTAMSSLQESITTIVTKFEELNTIIQNIYTELLSQGVNIKEIKDILNSFFSSFKTLTYTPYWYAQNYVTRIGNPQIQLTAGSATPINIGSFTNLISGIYEISYNVGLIGSRVQNLLANQTFRIYDIQTNFYTSIKIQKDISTNVSYIASIVSNMYAKSDNTDITNAYDQASDDYENKIKEDYESKEGELDQYEDKIKARNQSFRQNEDLVGQFTTLINSFRCDSLPEVATISIVNFKFGDNSALPSTSSLIIDLRRFSICFRAIRCLSAIFYWGVVLVLGYKITFIFVKFIRTNVLGIIPSTNKSDDGSFL